jgi:hypothetical protein
MTKPVLFPTPRSPWEELYVRTAAPLLVAALFVASCNGPLYSRCDDPRNDCNEPPRGGEPIATYRTANPASRPPEGGPVDFRSSVVIGVDDYLERANGNVGDMWVEQHIYDDDFPCCARDCGHCGRVCGILIFAPTVVPSGSHFVIGDLVNVAGGAYDEFICEPCSMQFDGRSLPEIGMPTVERVGTSRAPDPIDVTIAQLTDPDHGDDYVGVLVRITDTITTMPFNAMRSEITIAPGIQMTAQLTPLVDPSTGQVLPAGTQLRNIVGIASYFFSPKIIPRSVNDYEIVH